jgi:hypothetical protein
MPEKQTVKPLTIDRAVGELAHQRAESEFLRVTWPRFLEVCQQYVGWRELYYWTRTLVEHAGGVPAEHHPFLHHRCPAVFPASHALFSSHNVVERLSVWIDSEMTASARQEGWLHAVLFYGIRQPRYQQAMGYWLDCSDRWSKEPPSGYPGLSDWLKCAAAFNPAACMLPEHRLAWDSLFRVAPERLSHSVGQYLDWEVFSYWVRTALESARGEMPSHVKSELDRRCPGFLQHDSQFPVDDSSGLPLSWRRLGNWIKLEHFEESMREGWFEAVGLCVSVHPRHIRAGQFWYWWDEHYRTAGAKPYPAFSEWNLSLDTWTLG